MRMLRCDESLNFFSLLGNNRAMPMISLYSVLKAFYPQFGKVVYYM